MGEIIRDWLRTRLGVMIDLSPETFGHYARDGTLLGKVLHSYDVINDSQLSTLTGTQDPALARVNLKNLRAWLRFIGVDCDNDCIEDISNGKGTMALRLFYKVFLCLENKDRLHFVTLRKEREKYIPSSSKFDVTRVPEEEPEREQSDIRLYADTLMKSTSLIDWQKKRYVELMDGYRRNRDKFRSLQKEKGIPERSSISGKQRGERRATRSLGSTERRQLDEFSRKHRVKGEAADACETRSKREKSKTPRPDREAARAYTESLKGKRRQEAMTKDFKSRMQKNLLSELWNKVLVDQEQEFDEIIAKKVLHQSQYEKQLVRKLCEVRNEKTRMAGNRRIVERLLEETRESETRLEEERAREVMVREREEVEAEARRIHELEAKIEQQSRERGREKKRRYVERTVLDLVDIAARVAEYKAASYEDRVPEYQWNQWKALFLKNQPIAETYERVTAPDEVEPAREQAPEDETRVQLLNEEDFQNYHCAKIPWKDFIPEVDEQVGEYLNLGLVVLGYIVHKTLESSRHRKESVEPPLPAMKTRAVVLGVPDALLYEPIQQLLEARNIHLVRVEDAINHCLTRYKAEMQHHEYIDLDILAATRQSLASSSSMASDESAGQARMKKSGPGKTRRSESVRKMESAKKQGKLDKVTQTPRVIPHEDMDPQLSNAAYTGKWIYEFLSLGEPLSDDLVSRTILEYIRGLERIEGFLIVNYPNTRREMSALEFALSGRRLADDRVDLSNSGIDEIDEIDSIPSRIHYGEEEFADPWKESRLLPNPVRSPCSTGRTFFTSFVRIKPRLDSSTGRGTNKEEEEEDEDDDDDIWEIVWEDATSVDAFYVDQEIASVFYYTIFDVTSLKRLARLVIAESNDSLARVPSRELFGEYLNYFEGRRREDESSASKAPLVKRLLRRFSPDESRSYASIESRQRVSEVDRVGESREPLLPGKAEWPWADFYQPSEFLRNLGDLWRNMETRYVENLKEALHLKRMSLDGIASYADFVRRHTREYVERPDKRQDLLHEFHRAFNDVAKDIRDDRAVKEELHCRIEDFQTKLWDICDSRRREAEDERTRIIGEHWTSREAVNLVDTYVDIVQSELERCCDSLQFIQDYYASMLQRPLDEIRSEARLMKIQASEPQAKVTTSLAKTPQPPSPPDENLIEEEIGKLLADEGNIVPTETLCWRSLEANIRYVRGILDSLASRLIDNLKREESIAAASPFESRADEKASSGRVPTSGKADEGEKTRLRNLFNEWRYALLFEINRIRVRLKILESAARSDLDNLIVSMRQVFSETRKCLIDRYEREVRSVNEATLVFRLATDRGKPVQEETLLDGERFLVRSNVLMFPDGEDATSRLLVPEELLPTRFTVSQLSRLADTFGRVAPGGHLTERSFVYVLEDLVVCDEDRYANAVLPSSWYELRPCDVTRLVNELFGRVDYVDWREFLVYAMDLVGPSVAELLSDFRAFRRIDAEAREYVTREDFLARKLWFSRGNTEEDSSSFEERSNPANDPKPEDSSRRLELVRELLCRIFSHDDLRVNYVALLLAFCKDDEPEVGLGKALSLAIDKEVCTNWEEGEREYARRMIEGEWESGTVARREASEVCESIVKLLLRRVVRSSRAMPENSLTTVTSLLANVTRSRIEIKDSDVAEYSDDSIPTNDENSLGPSDELSRRFDGTEGRERRGYSVSAILPGGRNESEGYSRCDERVYWLDIKVPQTVLAAMLPDHAAQSNLFESGKSLLENLEFLSYELRDEVMNGDGEAGLIVPAHRFLRHDFVKKLLADTSKFTTKRLGDIVRGLVCDNTVHKPL